MQLTFEDTAAILDAKNESDLLIRVQLCARTLGFDRCLLGFEVSTPLQPKTQHVLSGYPDQWQREYHLKQYAQVDPTVSHCMTHADPIVWMPDMFMGEPKSQALLETARGFGLGHGMSIPIHDPSGAVSTMFSIARDHAIAPGAEMLQAIAGAKTIAAVAHVVASMIGLPDKKRQPPVLTKREKEVLRYIVIGKNRWEIAQILSISESSVAFHTSNILRKFDVSNKTHATAKAFAFCMVD